MAQRREIAAIYGAGVIQGIALVTFPAASAIFTSAAHYDFSTTEYGAMFVPQAITAITAALLGAGLVRRLGAKRIFLLGLVADLFSMALLVVSQIVMHEHSLAYPILFVATGFMGIGFGLTVPAINTFAAAFFASKVDKAVLALNALLGLGTALAPIFVAIFTGLGIWWGLPVLVSALLVGLLCFSFALPLETGAPSGQTAGVKAKLPTRFWLFAWFALLYGVCETMNGNWASLYMTKALDANTSLASLALTVFWGAVTAGRILLAAIEKWFPERRACVVLPIVVAAGFAVTALLPKASAEAGIAAFALSGLGCSALLPLCISFGQSQLTSMAESVAGGLIAFYQIGYGLAAFGVGPLQSWAGLSLPAIYGGTTLIALGMAALTTKVVSGQAAALPDSHASVTPITNH